MTTKSSSTLGILAGSLALCALTPTIAAAQAMAPNLVVTQIVGPGAAGSSRPMSVDVEVCNLGDAPATSGFDVALLFSLDTVIDMSDAQLGVSSLPGLDVARCAWVTVDATSPWGPLTGWLGAQVDPQFWVPELDELDNTLLGAPFAVGNDPDLYLAEIRAPASANGAFTAKVAVCNQGGGLAWGSVTVRLYASQDDLLELPSQVPSSLDVQLGQADLPFVEAGRCGLVEIDASAPPWPAGALYLGASVDEDGLVVELFETNNAAILGRMGVGTGPDLHVQALDAPPTLDGPFTATAKVCNRGTTPASGTDLTVFAASTASVDPLVDIAIGSAPVPPLLPTECQDVLEQSGLPPLPPGPAFLGALVDSADFVIELIEDDNLTVAGPFGAGAGPNLAVTELDLPDNAGTQLDARITVCNLGSGFASSQFVQLIASTDAVIDDPASNPWSLDIPLGGASTAPLAAGACETLDVSTFAPAPGVFTIGALVQDPGGLLASDDLLAGGPVGLGFGPDYVVKDIRYVRAPPFVGQDELEVEVCNVGTDIGVSVMVEVAAETSDLPLVAEGYPTANMLATLWTSPQLAPTQCETLRTPPFWTPNGAFYLSGLVDSFQFSSELRTDNNRTLTGLVGLGVFGDLTVAGLDLPPNVHQPFTVTVDVCNTGGSMTPGTDVTVYASADETIVSALNNPFTPDFALGSAPVPALEPGVCAYVPVSATPPPFAPGPYFVGAIVDPSDLVMELLDPNAPVLAGPIGFGFGPDLVVQQVDLPPSADGAFTVTVTACNQGTSAAPGTDVELYASTDEHVTRDPFGPDLPLGAAPVPGLQPGQCEAVPVSAFAPPGPTGAWFVAAFLDPMDSVPELVEDRPDPVFGPLGVGQGPDWVVEAVTVPPSADGTFTAQVRVCNRGTAAAFGTNVALFASTDETIDDPTSPWARDLPLGFAAVPSLASQQCANVEILTSAAGPAGPTFIGAIVDDQEQLTELVEGNNTFVAGPMGFGPGADYVARSITVIRDASAHVDAVDVEVCNEGTAPASSGVNIDLFASPYPRFPDYVTAPQLPDVWLANQGFTSALAAGACEVVRISWIFGPPGTQHVGALLDGWRAVPELREDNNLTVLGPVGIGPGTDLQVSILDAPPAADGPFSVLVEVCNDTSFDTAGATDLTVYASTDDQILSPLAAPWSTDLPIGFATVGPIDAAACRRVSVAATASLPAGPYWLGAIVDESNQVPETVESNNLDVTGPVGFGFGPLLAVTAADLPATLQASFDGAVNVCNVGTAPAPGTDVELRLSADTEIDTQFGIDLPVAAAPVPPLAAGQCAPVPVTGFAGVPPGAYYVGARVDPFDTVPELVEGRPAVVFGPYGVGDGPNLVVTQVDLPPSTNTNLDAQVTVCNVGTQPAGGSQVATLASSDPEIPEAGAAWTAEIVLGAAAVGPLQPEQCETVVVPGWAPTDGLYAVGARADDADQVFELVEIDNLRVAGPVAVGTGPNVVVRSVVVRPLPAPDLGEVEIVACNDGTAPSGQTWVDIAASATGAFPDPIWSDLAAVPVLTQLPVDPLEPGVCATLTEPLYSFPQTPGAYFVGALVTPLSQPELRTDDDLLVVGPVPLGFDANLVVEAVTAPVAADGAFTAEVRVCNQGFAVPAPGTQVGLWVSPDEVFEHPASAPWSSALFVGSALVDPLEPARCRDVSVSGFASVGPAGAYFLTAVADDAQQVAELSEVDNARTTGAIGLGFGPVLVVDALTAAPNQASTVSAQVVVCNPGTAPAPGTDVVLVASSDEDIDTRPFSPDLVVGVAPVPPLAAGACAAVDVAGGPAPWPDGAYFLGVIVDPADLVPELVEVRAPAVFGPFGFGFGPDLVVSQVDLPPSSTGAFTAQVTACNQGTAPAGGTDVWLVAPGDLVLGGAPLPALTEGACATVSLAASYPGPDGAVSVAARVDGANLVPELLEGNNQSEAQTMGFGVGPDLVVRDFVVPPVLFGGPLPAAATVCNDGTAPSPSTSLDVFVSESPDVPTDPAEGGIYLNGAPVSGLAPGACAVVSVDVYQAFFGGAVYLAASVDTFDGVPELVEGNNRRVVGPIGDGPGVELRIASATGPAFASPGQEITATVRVCNDGIVGSGGTDLRLLASADDDLDVRGLDPEVGFAPVPPIAGLGCVDVPVPTFGFGALAVGPWRLGAQVDPSDAVPELLETNNSALGGTVEIAVAFCGNGALDSGEACDDGNFVSGDGCTSACVVEFCGDGVVNLAEICDDGNSLPYDGCSPACVPQGTLLGEVMQISANQSGQGQTWYSLGFSAPLVSPVVVAHALSFNGGDPTHLRVRNVDGVGFEWKMEEWAYKDGNHTSETLPFLAVEAGRHVLEDGKALEAGSVSAGTGWLTVTFQAPFASTPVLLTGVMSEVDGTPVVVRTRNLTSAGFEVRIQEEEGQDGAHPAETVAFVALDPGVGLDAGAAFEAGRTPDAVTHSWYTLGFSAGFATAPVLLANVDTFDGGDTSGLRFRNVTGASAQVKVEEEKSKDSETNHTTERVSWLVWEAPGLIVAAP